MVPFERMTDGQLQELMEDCERSMIALTVNSKVPAENSQEYAEYDRSYWAIDDEMRRRARMAIGSCDDPTEYF